ncbi:hypothetical protein AAM31_004408 [Salmonella enterica subsp. enterica]|nr:hypothetical protein [Salmonella enterica subsp. enterica]
MGTLATPTHPAPQNAGQYFELPGCGQGVSSQPEAYEHDGRVFFLTMQQVYVPLPRVKGMRPVWISTRSWKRLTKITLIALPKGKRLLASVSLNRRFPARQKLLTNEVNDGV